MCSIPKMSGHMENSLSKIIYESNRIWKNAFYLPNLLFTNNLDVNDYIFIHYVKEEDRCKGPKVA